MNQHIELTLRGNLQGIGLRPFLWRLAQSLHIEGSVSNTPNGVVIYAQGPHENLQAFQQHILTSPTDFARIDSFQIRFLPLNTNIDGFSIAESIAETTPEHAIAPYAIPDLPPCQSCIAELLEPNHRRFMDPMISCTQCGPRYSIQSSTPFDRCRTSMAPYPLCDRCNQEYQNPYDRRFHSQTISCFQCGPNWKWTTSSHPPIVAQDAHSIQNILQQLIQYLLAGNLILVKSVGGYQFLCDPCNPSAVQALRELKHRPTKPFAILTDSLESALALVDLSPSGQSLLSSPERPIVIAHRTSSARTKSLPIPAQTHRDYHLPLASNLNPIDATLGVMLPNSPLHFLLLHSLKKHRQPPAILITSANQSNAPMLTDDATAHSCYARAVAGVLSHPRQIIQPLDDSVWIDLPQTTTTLSNPTPVRRARGASPMRFPILNSRTSEANLDHPPCIALGGDLKTTLAIRHADSICCSQHLGDASNPEVLTNIRHKITQELQAHPLTPLNILADDHPGYHSHRLAKEVHHQATVHGPVTAHNQTTVQNQITVSTFPHHYAHLASLACDLQLPTNLPFLSFVFDGTGYGTDQTIWGGELLLYRPKHDGPTLQHPPENDRTKSLQRIGHLKAVPLPRSDIASKHPWRCALAYLLAIDENPTNWLAPFRNITPQEQTILVQNATQPSRNILSSSIGRLIDAVASILDLVHDNEFEAHAAMRLEHAAWTHYHTLLAQKQQPLDFEDHYSFPTIWQDDLLLFDYSPTLLAILEDLQAQIPITTIAYRFHGALLNLILNALDALSNIDDHNSTSKILKNPNPLIPPQKTIGCTGGVFQNTLLLSALKHHIPNLGWTLLTHQQIPPNDAGISIGQAWMFASQKSQ